MGVASISSIIRVPYGKEEFVKKEKKRKEKKRITSIQYTKYNPTSCEPWASAKTQGACLLQGPYHLPVNRDLAAISVPETLHSNSVDYCPLAENHTRTVKPSAPFSKANSLQGRHVVLWG